MNALSLLKSLAPGFIPLFAYIAAELLFGETTGLIVGLAIGILEFLFSYMKEKKADLFIAADTLLLAAMGALSLLLQNQIFFRLKPAVIEGFLASAMAVLLFLPPETLKSYLGHQVRGIVLEDSSLPGLRRSLVLMIAVLTLHTGLTVWAALAASTALWGFVSGGLLYLMLGAAIAVQWLVARGKNKAKGSPPLHWRLLIFDETGRIYAGKTAEDGGRAQDGDNGLWDSPARGEAVGAVDLEKKLGQTMARLGIGAPPGAVGLSPAIIPAFMIDPSGRTSPLPADFNFKTLMEQLASMNPGVELVLAAPLRLLDFPKGIDPTERRLLSLANLEALAATGRLTPSFARIILILASLRHPLRAEAGASIVSDTNDAAV